MDPADPVPLREDLEELERELGVRLSLKTCMALGPPRDPYPYSESDLLWAESVGSLLSTHPPPPQCRLRQHCARFVEFHVTATGNLKAAAAFSSSDPKVWPFGFFFEVSECVDRAWL